VRVLSGAPPVGPSRELRHNHQPFPHEKARHGGGRAGPWPVQLRLAYDYTGAEYVSQQAWLSASLPRCPLHPQGGCGFARHGTYARVSPPGTRIARWYCPAGHRTFSLLPDCLAARLSGTLAEVEAVVRAAEVAPSREVLCDALRLDIELPGALRWVRRRVSAVHAALSLLRGLLPEPFGALAPTLAAFGVQLGVGTVLVALRGIAAALLHVVPAPLGFRPRRRANPLPQRSLQHDAGPDPPGQPA
jgi:hypothetical protein